MRTMASMSEKSSRSFLSLRTFAERGYALQHLWFSVIADVPRYKRHKLVVVYHECLADYMVSFSRGGMIIVEGRHERRLVSFAVLKQ